MVLIDRGSYASSLAEVSQQILGNVKSDQAARAQLGNKNRDDVDKMANAQMEAAGNMLVSQAKMHALSLARIPMAIGIGLQVADMAVNTFGEKGQEMTAAAGGGFNGWMTSNKSSMDALLKSMAALAENEGKMLEEQAKFMKELRKHSAAAGGLAGLQAH